jgi:hypothetical protein
MFILYKKFFNFSNFILKKKKIFFNIKNKKRKRYKKSLIKKGIFLINFNSNTKLKVNLISKYKKIFFKNKIYFFTLKKFFNFVFKLNIFLYFVLYSFKEKYNLYFLYKKYKLYFSLKEYKTKYKNIFNLNTKLKNFFYKKFLIQNKKIKKYYKNFYKINKKNYYLYHKFIFLLLINNIKCLN